MKDIMNMTLAEIKDLIEANQKRVDNSHYWNWDWKWAMLSNYNDLLSAVETIKQLEKLIVDNDYISSRIKYFQEQPND